MPDVDDLKPRLETLQVPAVIVRDGTVEHGNRAARRAATGGLDGLVDELGTVAAVEIGDGSCRVVVAGDDEVGTRRAFEEVEEWVAELGMGGDL